MPGLHGGLHQVHEGIDSVGRKSIPEGLLVARVGERVLGDLVEAVDTGPFDSPVIDV